MKPHRTSVCTFTTAAMAVAAACTLASVESAAQTGAQPAPAPRSTPGCAEIEVHNVRPRQGFLMLAVYADAESFNKKAIVSLRLPAGEGVTRVPLCGVPAGTAELAVTMFQDLDGNGEMGKNLLGIPTEPWGSSGTPGTFGPSWTTARVSVGGDAAARPIVVKLST